MLSILSLTAIISPHFAAAATFAGGNFIVLRTRASGGVPTTASTAVFLDEMTVAGSVAQTVNVSASRSLSPQQVTPVEFMLPPLSKHATATLSHD
jgi:hypothetical protein